MEQLNKEKIDLDNHKLKEILDEELRDRILNINKKQLSKIGEMSYYYFIGSSMVLVQLLQEDSLLQEIKSEKEKKTLIKNFDCLIEYFKQLHGEMEKEEIEKEIEILLNIRKELFDLSTAINGYEAELFYIKTLLDHHTMKIVGKEEYKNKNIDKKEITFLISRIDEELDQNIKENFTFVNVISSILSLLPFRMSKFKYFDVIKTTLIRNLNHYPINIVEGQIEDYKMLFDSTLIGNYGIDFDDYFTEIQRFKNISIENRTLEELDDITKDIIDLNSTISKIGDFINSLGLLVNRLLILYMTKDKIVFNPKMNDLFSMWGKYEDEMEKELISSLIEMTFNESKRVEKELLKDVKNFEELANEGLNRFDFFDNDLNEEMLFTKKILNCYNDMEFSRYEVLFPQRDEVIDEVYLEQLVDSLIQYIDRSISSMGNIERKIRMRRLLSLLELPFANIEEFLSYVEYSLDEKIVSKEEILFTIDTINYWLNGLKEG